jgi:hypothetical protein
MLVDVDSATLDSLEKAAQMYEGIASGKFSLFVHEKYKFAEPDLTVAQDHADRLRELRRQMS